ncbi:MAG: hypothetical protein LBO78_01855 [Rickettsiales bacterium]|jgi:hypothetical protein|nr:hypothetical protein [Rickettsiales bacterium]
MRLAKRYKWLFSFISAQIPFISSFLVLMLSFADVGPHYAKPVLVLIPIFFWAMTKTAHMEFISIMLFGFVEDFMDGTPFGLNIFIFLSLYFIVYYQKMFPLEESFIFSYLAFSVLTLVLFLFKYAVTVMLFVPNLGFFNILLSWAVLILLYPMFYYMLSRLYVLVRKY